MYLNLKQESSRALRLALGANAAFSAVSGALMLFAESQVQTWLGIGAYPIWPIGLMLLLFAAYLLWMTRSERVPEYWVKGVIGGDWAWVVGSLALLLLYGEVFSGLGRVLVIDVTVVVGLFALLQTRGLRKSQHAAIEHGI